MQGKTIHNTVGEREQKKNVELLKASKCLVIIIL